MAITYVYMLKAEESRQSQVNLYNNLPDGIMVIKINKTPKDNYKTSEEVSAHIVTGDVGATHYDLLYCNQQTDLFFNVKLSTLDAEALRKSDYQLLAPRNLTEVNIEQCHTVLTSTVSAKDNLQSSDFNQKFNISEVLQTFSPGGESSIFQVTTVDVFSEQ